MHHSTESTGKNKKILCAGDTSALEFQSIFQEIQNVSPCSIAFSIREALSSFSQIDVVLFFQSQPFSCTQQEVNELRQRFPLIQIYLVSGSWLDGQGRSGTTITGAHQFFWHQWPNWRQVILGLNASQNLMSHSPLKDHLLTSSVNQKIQKEMGSLDLASALSINRAIVAAQMFDDFDYHKTAFETFKIQVSWYTPGEGFPLEPTRIDHTDFDLACWVGISLDQNTKQQITQYCQQFRGLPLLVSLESPRREDQIWLDELGVARLFQRPFELTNLSALINDLQQCPVYSQKSAA